MPESGNKDVTTSAVQGAKPAMPRVRLLPVLAGVMALVLTIRVGDVYQHVTLGVGSETQAQTTPAANAASTAAPAANAASTAAPANAAPTAPAENATATEPPATSPATPPKDPLEYTDEEVEVLQQLAKRREEIELKS